MDNGLQLILNRLLFPNEPLQLCRYKGLEFITDLAGGEASGAREILTTDEYSRHLSHIRSKKPLTVLDIGANNGGFGLLLLANGYEIHKLVAVELNPNTFRRLRFNIERNVKGEVDLKNVAVSGDGRPIRFADTRGSTSDNIYGNADGGPGSQTVQGTTLDQLITDNFNGNRIDICKIDIEGAEFEIFLEDNCRSIRQADLLVMEIHHSESRDRMDVINRLAELGFEEVDAAGKDDDAHHVHVFLSSEA